MHCRLLMVSLGYWRIVCIMLCYLQITPGPGLPSHQLAWNPADRVSLQRENCFPGPPGGSILIGGRVLQATVGDFQSKAPALGRGRLAAAQWWGKDPSGSSMKSGCKLAGFCVNPPLPVGFDGHLLNGSSSRQAEVDIKGLCF